MSSWIDLLVDNNKIKGIFGESIISLKNVSIHEIAMKRDGPAVTFRFDVEDYPVEPPKKWIDNGFNTVQIILTCVDVRSLTLSGLSRVMKADLVFEKLNNEIGLHIRTDTFDLNLTCSFLMVESISAYIDSL